MTTLTVGQRVTIIEKGKYKNVDGYDWSRIILSDGTQGYIVARYLEEVSDNGSTSDGKDIVKVVCNSLTIRKSPGTSSSILGYADKGDYLTRIEKGVSTANGYTWDKVVTGSGVTGYVARGDSDENYIEPVNSNTGSSAIKGDGFKTTGSNLVCEPDITVQNILSESPDVTIKNASGKTVTSGSLGTGYTVKIGGTTYTVVKKGDVSGDGKITAGDYVKIKNDIMDKALLSPIGKQGADVNGDGKVTAGDYVQVKNHIMGKGKITI